MGKCLFQAFSKRKKIRKETFMTSLTKKLFLSLFSVAAAVCLAVGIFALPVQKSSALSADIVTLNDIGDFDIEGTVLSGLSPTGEEKIGGKPMKL